MLYISTYKLCNCMIENVNIQRFTICLLIDGFGHGGIQQAYLQLIKEYIRKSYNVVLVIANRTSKDLNILSSSQLQIFDLNADKLIDVKAIFKLFNIIKETKPEFIIANMFRSQIWSTLVKSRNSKLIWVEQNTHFSRKNLQWLVMKVVSRRVSKIVCISNDVMNLTNLKIRQSKKTFVIPNPIVRNQNRIENQRKKDFVFIGRMIPQKNPELVINSFAKLIKKYGVDSQLHLIGDGVLKQKLQNLSITLGIENQCNFYGWLENPRIYEILNHSYTLVSTSLIEGMALVRFEALENGCCVITTNTGGTIEYLSEGLNHGVFFVPNKIDEIAQYMFESLDTKYWSEENILKRISINDRFDVSIIAQELIFINN
jgi:glycosyltransferase involved in cell wall biosynthesis